ncbi:MAG: aldehyde dehydrogenase family protein, partial [candidate division Zixibacteria bacterium]|nr:aldehyde dehydrogenase family protein [candidate division Zixibacteria bacterium]
MTITPRFTDLYISGQWQKARSGKTFTTICPITTDPIAEIAEADAAEVDLAVQAARTALTTGPWATMSAAARGRLLWKIADELEARSEHLINLETLDNGKPIFESKIDLYQALGVLRYFAGWADKIQGDTIPVEGNHLVYTRKEPVGVVGAIVPWNFPLLMAIWKIAPALCCGNTPGVDKIAFTGSTEVGREIARRAADTLKRVTLELGGKSALVVLADADLDAAMRGSLSGIFYGKGEVCAATSRLLVHSKVHDELLEKVVAKASRFAPADPFNPKTRMGALVSETQMNRVLRYIDTGKREKANLVTGGGRADGLRGYFVQPTI